MQRMNIRIKVKKHKFVYDQKINKQRPQWLHDQKSKNSKVQNSKHKYKNSAKILKSQIFKFRTMSAESYEHIQKLLQFQSNFINLVHKQILSFQQQQQRRQAELNFQIMHMGDHNEVWNKMITGLKKQLCENKEERKEDNVLKSQFVKLLDVDYLPFLHINRYELTKVAIFGFDIYIDPLQAILQILNRLERIFEILQQNLKEKSPGIIPTGKNPWQVLLSGWKQYYIYLQFNKLSLNLYMLKQYILTAGSSLFKKDKQIVFTGVYSLYKKFIPQLVTLQISQVLQQLADINNVMYNFHGSFDYFGLYTYLKPQKKFLKIYERIYQIEKKCKHTNILTPLLFGVMNHYRQFVQFVEKVNGEEFKHLLKVLLAGLIVNFKLRILEYQEILHLINLTITKLCLLNSMEMKIITADLGKEWNQAKDFFISAFKSGYNAGQIQTWNLCQSEQIQPKVRKSLIYGLLLLDNGKYHDFIQSIDRKQLQQILSNQISEITKGSQTFSSLSNNWKKSQIQQNKSKDQKSEIQQFNTSLYLIRIVNLLNILQSYSQKVLYTICSFFVQNNVRNSLLRTKLQQSAQVLNEMITSINRKESISNLKDILPQYHIKYPPRQTFEDIVPVYLHCFILKEAISNIFEIILCVPQQRRSSYIRQFITLVIQKAFVKPSQNSQILTSFQKSYQVPSKILFLDQQTNNVFANLIKIITSSKNQKKNLACECLLNLLKFCPWATISVLNLPSVIDQNIQSFFSWLINHKVCGRDNFRILTQILGFLQSYSQDSKTDLQQYLQQSYYTIISDNILSSLNALTAQQNWESQNVQVFKILDLIDLFVEIKSKFCKKSMQQSSPNDQEHLTNQIWQSVLEILFQILRNTQFSLQKLYKICKIYWQIIKYLKGDNLVEWYQKISLNRIFSTSDLIKVEYSNSFNGIISINNNMNYMISKETSDKNNGQENKKQKNAEKYDFAGIKQFFQKNFYSFCLDSNQSSNKNSESLAFLELKNVIDLSKNQRKVNKIYINTLNEKEILPSLKQQLIEKVYEAYIQSKNQVQNGTNLSELQFCLHLIKINPNNHKSLWKLLKASKCKWFLSEMNFTRQTIAEIIQILDLLETQKLKSEKEDSLNKQNTQSSFSVDEKISKMMNFSLISTHINEIQLLASSFDFDKSQLQTLLKRKNLLWFLIVCNNSNWRQFNECISNYFRQKNLLSTILQYKQFISITKKSSDDYENEIKKFSQLLSEYSFYIQKKIEYMNSLRNSDSEKQNQIRRSTLIINIKVVLMKCDFEKIMERIQDIGRQIHSLSLPENQFQYFFAAIHQLNRLCNILISGNIMLPNFSYHNRYLTALSEEKQFLLGRWIEKAQISFDQKYIQNQEHAYQPLVQLFKEKNNLNEFLQDTQIEENFSKVLLRSKDMTTINSEIKKLRVKLQQTLNFQENRIQISQNVKIINEDSIFNQLYNLGYLEYLVSSEQKLEDDKIKFSKIITSLVERQKLPLQLIKQRNTEWYYQLKLLQMKNTQASRTSSEKNEQQLSFQKQAKQDVYFVFDQKQLIPKGKQIKVTQNNQHQYTDFICKQIFGKQWLKRNKFFALGYLNARIYEAQNVAKKA